MKVVAEGIETAQAVATLTEFDCDIGQGYHLCRPVLPDALMLWYAKQPVRPGPRRLPQSAPSTEPSGFASLRAT